MNVFSIRFLGSGHLAAKFSGLAIFVLLGAGVYAEYQSPRLLSELAAATPVHVRHLRMPSPSVELIVQLDVEGEVVDVVSLEAPHYDLLERAEKAARRGKYTPAETDGERVPSYLRVRVNFYDPGAGIDGANFQSGIDHIEAMVNDMKSDEFTYSLTKPSKLDSPLKMIRRGEVIVPADADGTRLGGACVIEFYVDRNGDVKIPRVIKTDGTEISKAAILSLQGSKFSPPTINDKPTVVKAQMPFSFKADEEEVTADPG